MVYDGALAAMSVKASSKKAIIAALTANAAVTLIKFIAFALSGSGAMLSEAIHSTADTGNQMLLFLGQRRALKEADDRFHYGYGGERYIFGMLSAAGIFFIGCGVTVYHGVTSILHPHMPHIATATFAVLGASFLVEGAVLIYAVRFLIAERGELPFWRYVRERADPAAVAILLEDSAAVVGVVLAGSGILLAKLTGQPLWDALASIFVGLLLGGIAIYLAISNRELLLGRSIPDATADRFIELLRQRGTVREVRDVKTREISPEVYALKAEISLDERWLARRLSETAPQTIDTRDRELLFRRIAGRTLALVREEIAALEKDVRAGIPEARHIDLEIAHAGDPDADEPPEG